MLRSEQNTPAMGRKVLRDARLRLGKRKFQTDFEHEQWWVTDLRTGAQWSVVDCETQTGQEYFDFEQVSRGDDE